MKPTRPRECPCYSGARYSACCEPFHAGRAEAPTPEALMRSRYAAFALGLGGYLLETLSAGHPDRDLPPDDYVRQLSRAREKQRFMGLTILEASEDGDRGEVRFHARIFERGQDRSFTERSAFVREDGAWRYDSGEVDM
ncbi:YchJ family protein [Pendulispora albinea]|uniref:YchJ-like middle NTF2-like domain-containing protein n=1 Tax=Pendulispora albinea TaxID=2741071 RepID=A0ABZ2M8S5_9BACT